MRKNDFIRKHSSGNDEVVRFIANFLYSSHDIDISPQLTDIFTNGYCYYFAKMLQDTFNRGNLVVDKQKQHVAWQDVDGTVYDITGITSGAFTQCDDKYCAMYKKQRS